MEVKTVHSSKLNPAKYNPRIDLKPGDPEYDSLKASLGEFGYVSPIIWNERTGNVVSGHQRLKILLEQGQQEIEVSVVDLDDAKEMALNLALNKISGDWDNERLAKVFDELAATGIDMILTGFDPAEIDLFTVPDDLFADYDETNLATDYKAPEKKQLKCPKCSHVDTADRFAKQ